MNTLIIKLGATGDVVRTTPLLWRLRGSVTWVTNRKNATLLEGIAENLRVIAWEERYLLHGNFYDLVINLEDERETAAFLNFIGCAQIFGAYLDSQECLRYTEDAQGWFDLSLISRFGRVEADRLKLENRRTYQDLVFAGLGFRFAGERYCLPEVTRSDLRGDVALAPDAGSVWPMKKWAHYDLLRQELEAAGLTVHVLPMRCSLSEHLADVRGHRCLISGDSLPMHLALGSGIPCVSLFTCTSPWEIHDYGLQEKIVSPLLDEFFYQRGFDVRATTAIGLDEVIAAVFQQLEAFASTAPLEIPA